MAPDTSTHRNPRNPAELYAAAAAAELLLRFVDARTFGLLDTAGQINFERCESILAAARRAGLAGPPHAGPPGQSPPIVINVFNQIQPEADI